MNNKAKFYTMSAMTVQLVCGPSRPPGTFMRNSGYILYGQMWFIPMPTLVIRVLPYSYFQLLPSCPLYKYQLLFLILLVKLHAICGAELLAHPSSQINTVYPVDSDN